MARSATHRNGIRKGSLHLVGLLATFILATFPGFSGGATTAAAGQPEMVPRTGPNYLWLWMISNLEELLRLIEEGSRGTAGGYEGTEPEAIDAAREVSAGFGVSGFRADLSPAEVADVLGRIDALRGSILDDPQIFMDPYWESFLDTLDDMEAELLSFAMRGGA